MIFTFSGDAQNEDGARAIFPLHRFHLIQMVMTEMMLISVDVIINLILNNYLESGERVFDPQTPRRRDGLSSVPEINSPFAAILDFGI